MSDVSNLHEALDFYGDPDSYTGNEQVVLAAARLVASLLEPCPTCDGKDVVIFKFTSRDGGGGGSTGHPCPNCSGSGVQVSVQAIDLVEKEWDADVVRMFDTDEYDDPAWLTKRFGRVLRALLLGDGQPPLAAQKPR